MATQVEEAVAEAQAQLVPVGSMFELGDFALTARSDGPPPTLAQCGAGMKRLLMVRSRLMFYLGDLMNLAESLYSEEASQIIDHEDIDERTAKDCTFVAAHVHPRIRGLAPERDPWPYCQAVAKLKPEQQEEFLRRAAEEDWSVPKLKTEITAANAAGGKSAMRFLLIVDCKTEPGQGKLAKELEGRGLSVTSRSGLKREPKAKKKGKAKRGEVTAQKRKKGAPKMYTRRRPPT